VVGIQETDDTLENVNIADADRKLEREKIMKRNRQPIYSALDDYEFQEGVAPGTKAPILPQYEKEKKQGAKLQLGDDGTVQLTAYPMKTSTTSRLGEVQSLTVEKRDISDYYTKKEFSKFSKAKGDKKKRKLRKRDDDDDEEEGENGEVEVPEASSLDAVMMVVESNEVNPSADRGNRDSQSAMSRTLQEMAAEEAQRRQNFNTAVLKASGVAPVVTEDTSIPSPLPQPTKILTKPAVKKATKAMDFKSIDLDDDDVDMVQALARARRIALQSREREATNDNNDEIHLKEEDMGAKEVSRLMQKVNAAARANMPSAMVIDDSSAESKVATDDLFTATIGADDDIDVDGRRKDGTLIFNSTTEFTNRLQARLNDNARSKAEYALKEATRVGRDVDAVEEAAAIVANKDTNKEEEKDKDAMQVESDEDDEENDDEEDEENSQRKVKKRRKMEEEPSEWRPDDGDDQEDAGEEQQDGEDEQMAFLHKQPLFASGMAATLQLLKGSGELKKSVELAGRAKDRRENDPSADDFGVNLEYRDEYGRKLTQKEAFRQLSYRFHGYGPGKKKLDKRLKAMEVQTKATSSRAGILDGVGGTMKSLTTAQAATGKAHITIQGGVGNAANSAAVTANLVAMLSKGVDSKKKKAK